MSSTTYLVTIGGAERKVSLRREGGTLYASVDEGPERVVALRTLRGPLRSLAIGDRRLEVLAETEGESVRVALRGLAYRADVVEETRARLARVAGARHDLHRRLELRAPMPGLVVKVLCQVGDQIARGQPLVVLQAMKMENELSLPQDGTVKTIAVESGRTVEQGQTLVVLE